MLILYSDFFLDDSIGIFMRYPCLKIMSVFHITLKTNIGLQNCSGKHLCFSPAKIIYLFWLKIRSLLSHAMLFRIIISGYTMFFCSMIFIFIAYNSVILLIRWIFMVNKIICLFFFLF